jgi:hypothetical protein
MPPFILLFLALALLVSALVLMAYRQALPHARLFRGDALLRTARYSVLSGASPTVEENTCH